MVVSLCPITQRVCDTIMSPLVFLTEFQELFTLDCEETTSEENSATTSQVKTGWYHPLVSWLYRNKCGSPSTWYTLTLLSTFHTRLSRKAFLCLFVCFSKRYLYTSMTFLISTETKEKGPLQLAIYVVQNRHPVEQKSHWDKTNRGNYLLKLIMCSFCLFNLVTRALLRGLPTSKAREKRPGDEVVVWLVPVRLLLSSMAVLYHVNG